LQGESLKLFPAFGASMSFMRARFARDLHGTKKGQARGVHILPRVGFSEQERLEDVRRSSPAKVGVALGIGEDKGFLETLLAEPNLIFVSLDIAHGANAAVLPVLARLRALGLEEGVILGNVGSVEGFVYAYWLMKLSGFKSIVIKVGVGPGSVCTTRINTGVGVGQFTLLEHIARVRRDLGYEDVTVISDGGVNSAGDFVKALALSEGVMMGKFFASASFEDEVLDFEGGELKGVHLYGMASAMVTEKRNYIEGSSQTLRSFHQNAGEAVKRLREGLQSAMTYVNAADLAEFRSNVRFATNSHAAILESGVH
jgi:IMP dehydrogenase